MSKLLNEVIHKMRTPTVAIQDGIAGIKHFLPQLVEAYGEAKKNGLNVPEIQTRHLDVLLNVMNNIENEASFMNNYLNELAQQIKEEINNE